MRCDNTIFELRKTAVFRRLFREYVESYTCNPFCFKGLVSCVLVDNPAAGTVDKSYRRFHHFNLLIAYHIKRLLISRHMYADIIRFFEEAVQVLGNLDAEFLRVRRCSERVIAKYFHIKTLSHPGYCHADTPHTYKTQHFAVELVTHIFFPVPRTALETAACRNYVTTHSQHQRHGMLCRAECIATGCVHNYYAAASSFGYVNIIDSNSGTGDSFEFAGVSQHFWRNLGAASNYQPVELADNACQLILTDTKFNYSLSTFGRVD